MSSHPIYRHGPLEELAPGLWRVRGSLGRSPLPRNMVLYRLPDGGLLIHGAVAMHAEGMAALEALGPPRLLVVPNGFHRFDAPFYAARYPGMKVLCPAFVRRRAEQRVRVDGLAEDVLPPLGVVCHQPDGVRQLELIYELPLPSGRALVWADLLFNLPRVPSFGGWVTAKIGSSGFFGMTRIGRWFTLKDARDFAAWLRRMSELPGLSWLIMAHGSPIGERCGERLREAAARLAA